ncbi:MAG: glycosyltransferase family 4 protein [Eubacteriales bacterium]
MKKKKDILFLCQFFYPEYISSATLPYDTAKALSQERFSVGVLCGYPKEYNDSKSVLMNENHDGIEIKRLKYIQMKRSNFLGRLINYFSFTVSVLTRFISIRNYKSIIVYSNPPVLPMIASLANRIFGTKIIFVSYDIYPEIAIRTNIITESSIICKTMRFINRSLYKNVTKVVALSNDMKKFLLTNRSQLTENQITVIPNWFEDRPIKNIEKSYSNLLFENIKAKEKLVISYFGNMGTAQDLKTLIEAMKILKDDTKVIFIFAGHGNKLPLVKEVVQKEEIKNVFIYDFLRGEDFQDALNISDVFVVSLEAGLTGLAVPSKTYSYLMAGKPIISIMSKDADISEDLIDNEAGYSTEVGDVSSLISAINALKNDQEKRITMGENARELFRVKYTTEKSTLKYVNMMKSVLEEKSNVSR